MGQSLKKTLGDLRSLQGQTKLLWDGIEKHHRDSEFYLEKREEILLSPIHRDLPVWAKESLRGYDKARWDMVWRLFIFSYVLGKRRVTIESAAWKKATNNLLERVKRGTFDPDSGRHVWRADISKFWN